MWKYWAVIIIVASIVTWASFTMACIAHAYYHFQAYNNKVREDRQWRAYQTQGGFRG